MKKIELRYVIIRYDELHCSEEHEVLPKGTTLEEAKELTDRYGAHLTEREWEYNDIGLAKLACFDGEVIFEDSNLYKLIEELRPQTLCSFDPIYVVKEQGK